MMLNGFIFTRRAWGKPTQILEGRAYDSNGKESMKFSVTTAGRAGLKVII